MPLPLSPFRRAAAAAVAQALGVEPELFTVSTPPDPAMGDFSVACFPAAKPLRKAPAALAAQAAAAIAPGAQFASVQAAGPYVNFRVQPAALFGEVFRRALAERSPIPDDVGKGGTVCIDFSSPNIAKQLAYHHIRSTVIGHALANLHRALGYHVVGINHLGDWGTSFGMIIAAYQRWGPDTGGEPLTIEKLNDLYVRFRKAAKDDPALEAEGRATFKRLEDGDPTARALWQRFREVSLAEFQEAYDILDVRFDSVKGESEYEAAMPSVISLLAEKGLTSISEDALVVDLSELKMPPLLLRKTDGATLYATRDLAAAIYRWETYHFVRSLYVVGTAQALHFAQLIAVLKKAGFEWASRMEHVPFGMVKMGGQVTRSREGNVVMLKEVLAEAEATIVATLKEKNPDLPPAQVPQVARQVGIGAIVFANLISQREKDMDFTWEQILSFEGDAGPYVQYAHARTASILRKAGSPSIADLASADPAPLTRPEELALARLLGDLGDECQRAALNDEPHVVARYLLDVCAAFSRWYALGNADPALKVLSSDPATARARLALTASTQAVLRAGLGVLGIAAPEAM